MSPRRPWPRPFVTCALALTLTAGPAGTPLVPAAAARHQPGTQQPADPGGEEPAESAQADRATAGPDAEDPGAGRPTAPAEPGTGPEPGAAPQERDAAAVLSRLRDLYREIGAAEEAARVGQERLRAQERRVAGVSAELAEARDALAAARAAAGRLARAEYRAGGARLPAGMRSLLAARGPDPLAEADRRDLLERAGSRAAKLVNGLAAREERADALAERSRAELDTEQTLAAYQQEQRTEVTARVEEAEKLLSSLSDTELAGLRGLEQWTDVTSGTGPAAEEERGTAAGAPGAAAEDGGGDLPPSAGGRRAVEHARARVAPPGAPGGGRAIAAATLGRAALPGPVGPGPRRAPGSGAASAPGLVVEAWARAGLRIPLTPREQWAALERVATDRLRPGDIVVLGPEAAHSVLYAGDGQVLDRPFPGAATRSAPLDPGRVQGAVRPDPGAPGVVCPVPGGC
ncbi:NlpC/P60 family protein, partial [Streptomyces bohaiensis]|uniref:NlpC/P60 family protein n=1 Tax=Streptomyces bohaiensis TaxID=1431344 RepID=UPI0030C73E02